VTSALSASRQRRDQGFRRLVENHRCRTRRDPAQIAAGVQAGREHLMHLQSSTTASHSSKRPSTSMT
jgi:formylmethanofuran dehydrogenase subunit E